MQTDYDQQPLRFAAIVIIHHGRRIIPEDLIIVEHYLYLIL